MTRIRFSGCVLSLGDEAPRWAKATIALVGEKLPKMVELSEPRQLDEVERSLLDFILAEPNVLPELLAQAASAQVISTCDCGCRSVGLAPDPAAPDAAYDAVHGTVGLTAEGLSNKGTEVEVTLHVVFDRMTELEIWDGAFTNGESRGELPDITTLQYRKI